jgi:hypothetical protein
MPKCIILNQEITNEECSCVQEEVYKDKPKIAKKFKRIISWNFICKECQYHKKG